MNQHAMIGSPAATVHRSATRELAAMNLHATIGSPAATVHRSAIRELAAMNLHATIGSPAATVHRWVNRNRTAQDQHATIARHITLGDHPALASGSTSVGRIASRTNPMRLPTARCASPSACPSSGSVRGGKPT
ncbi:MAG TPA: hypothetical protein VL598_03345, partial [Trinickia sp.]|uniref:hypothetical protein n=1 Tax=Trinickia sp. TaxID=2571163 RepID=UPI002BDFCB26